MFNEQILDPFISAVNQHANQNAFCINDKFYNYNQFAKCISSIRHEIRTRAFVSKNIGLVANDDIETYASIFAIWLEGLCYVPLHPLQPKDRLIEIITQAEIELIIDSKKLPALISFDPIVSSQLPFVEVDLRFENISDDSLAYILFTSGSTGKPKGVQLSRGNIGAFMKSFWEAGFNITEDDRCLQCFDLTFDVSVQSYLVPLLRGACTYTIPHDQIKYSYVFGLLEDHQLTFGAMAPSMIRLLRPYFDEIQAPSMRYNILTAEASPLDIVNEWHKCIPNAEIFDFYGPTEATIYCTYYKVEKSGNSKQLNGMLSIGKPMNGLVGVILDENNKMLAPNQKGELCIAGPQLTKGYWKNPEKNAAVFVYLELNGISTRFYRTGDLCYFDGDGDIMYAGRLDYQVKIQGYRIELGEIEYHARAFLNGRNAVAVAYSNKIGNTEIALFVEGAEINEMNMVDYLKSKMPHYMIPSKILVHEIFPLNTNGKIDRNVLRNNLKL
jgi:amino acid adenylation domain-containing protein